MRILVIYSLLLISQIAFGQNVFKMGEDNDTIYYDPSNPPQVFKGGVVYAINFSLPASLPKTNLLGYWSYEYGINPDSTIYLVDANNNPVDTIDIIGLDWDITNDSLGIPFKTAATLDFIGTPIVDTACWNHPIYPTAITQNIDHDSTTYFKINNHVLNDDGSELYPERVTAIAIYSSKTDANSYFGVPELTSGAKWIDPVFGNDATGNGSYSSPYKTFATTIAATSDGGTIYIKSGDIAASCYIANKGITIKGVGNTRNSRNTSYCFLFAASSVKSNTISNIVCTGGAGQGVYTQTNANITANNMVITAANPIRKADYNAGIKFNLNNCVTTGQLYANVDTLKITGSLIKTSTIPVLLYLNYSSRYNIYKGSPSSIISRNANTTSITLFNDHITGNIFTDGAIATVTGITVNYCTLYPNASGTFISLINAASKVSFNINNNTIIQTNHSDGTGFNLKGYDINFLRNTVTGQSNNIISATALADDKTFTFGNNTCTTDSIQLVYSTDYKFVADSNIMIAGKASGLRATAVNYDNIPANIFNNYMASKRIGAPFVYLGTEYDTTKNGYLNGSNVYNNRFSGPADWGNPKDSFHGLFLWNQQANWHHNYLSGTFLGFVLKADGGTYANAVHHNIIKDCDMSYTIKGINGTLIYNNTSYNALGYDGLPEMYTKVEGSSGNSTIKNNIFYDTDSDYGLIRFESATDSTGCIVDTNIYWNGALNKIGNIISTNYTLAQWKVLGFDLGSLDTNPNFTSATQLWPVTPFNGTNLGTDYDDGLDISTTWGSSTAVPNIVTKQQGATWQIGAYVQ